MTGLCQCGCGQATRIARRTRGDIRKGQPLPFIHGHSGGRARSDVVERFFALVDVGGPDACWEWQGSRNQGGYGKFWLDGRTVGAHRFALETRIGPLGDETQARHRCDNPPCCNPSHLEPGTMAENDADKDLRGRRQSGEQTGRALLTAAQVQDARRRHRSGETHRQIAHELGVSRSTIQAALSGRTWAGVQ